MQIQTSAANAASGGVTDSTVTTSDVIYAQNPGIYINCITCGTTLPSGVTVYRVTAIGYGGIGGTNGTVAIVQSVVASAGPVATLPPNYGSF
jgi:Tfp pilus assembly protein PilX